MLNFLFISDDDIDGLFCDLKYEERFIEDAFNNALKEFKLSKYKYSIVNKYYVLNSKCTYLDFVTKYMFSIRKIFMKDYLNIFIGYFISFIKNINIEDINNIKLYSVLLNIDSDKFMFSKRPFYKSFIDNINFPDCKSYLINESNFKGTNKITLDDIFFSTIPKDDLLYYILDYISFIVINDELYLVYISDESKEDYKLITKCNSFEDLKCECLYYSKFEYNKNNFKNSVLAYEYSYTNNKYEFYEVR